MASGFYLLDHANRVKQYGEQRRGGEKPSGTIIIHTAENVADQVGADLGAESVARYCTTRDNYGAYHRLVDADTIVKMVPFGYETWHCTKTNPWSIGISAAVEAGDWKRYGDDYETAVLRNLARAAAEAVRSLKKDWGITVPIKHISGSAARSQAPGFTGHGETDPGRRSDPGADFDWDRFLSMVRSELNGTTTQEDDMPLAPDERKQLDDLHRLLLRKVADGDQPPGDVVEIQRRDMIVTRRTEEDVNTLLVTNRALVATVQTLAKSVGVDPALVVSTLNTAVRETLSAPDFTIVLTSKEN